MASSVSEVVDISSLGRETVSVSMAMRPEDAAVLTAADLDARCSAAAGAAACLHGADAASGRVSFTMVGAPRLGVEEVSLDGATLRVWLSCEHRPLQFALAPGMLAMRRNLTIRYPTHATTVDGIVDVPTVSTFALEGPARAFSLPASVDEQARALVAGDAVFVPRLAGSLCLAAVVDAGGSRPAASEVSPRCEPFAVPVPGGPGSELVVVAIDASGPAPLLSSARVPLSPSDRGLALSISLASDVVGTPSFEAVVSANEAVDECEVSLLDMEGRTVERTALPSCGRVRVGTGGLGAGRYLVRASARSGERSGVATRAVTLVATERGGRVFSTDKDVYTAGESISVFPEQEGDVCEITVSDMDGVTVMSSSAGGCSPSSLALEDGLLPGRYEVRTDLYRDGRLEASGARTIEVVEWRPRPDSAVSALCTRGSLAVPGASIPCIGPRMACQPTSEAVPLCLCFDGAGRARDVCEYRETCLAGQARVGKRACSPAPSSASPFTVVRSGGRCVAKRGLESLTCVETGELCAGTCVCLDAADRAISPCTAGQVCARSGCRLPAMAVELRKMEPVHVRSDAMEDGVRLTWRASVRSGPGMDEGRLRERLAASAFLGGTAGRSPDASWDPSTGEWRLAATFADRLSPGAYDAFLMLSVDDEMVIVRRPFEVWYPLDESEVGMEVVSVSPGRISLAEVEAGATVRLGVRMRDASGRDLPHIPASALSLRVGEREGGGVRADVSGASRDPATGLWTVVGYLRGKAAPSTIVSLAARHLGRTGLAQGRLEVVERVPLSVRILRVEPGTREAPLFLALAGLGFDMDVILAIQGGEMLSRESFTVRLGGRDASGSVSFLYPTGEGVRLHLAGVRLCPPPERAGPLEVAVSARDIATGEVAGDAASVQLAANPGDWRDLEGGGCA